MENAKAVLLLAVIALFGACVLLFLQYRSADAERDEATLLGTAVRELFAAQRVSCNADATQYAKLAGCIRPLLVTKDFREDSRGFKQPDPKTGAAGYLVIVNVNRETYDAEKFTFLYNRDLVQEGCSGLTGLVDKDVTCRFEFTQYCEPGTVLEVTYPVLDADGKEQPVRVFLKTC